MSTKKPAPPKSQPAIAVKKYCLSLIEWIEGDPGQPTCMGEIDIPADTFQAMQKKANAADDDAFNALLTLALAAMMKPIDSCALENAVAANNALTQLLFEHMELERHDSGVSAFSGLDSGPMVFGIFQLMNICRERLNAAAEVAA